MSIAAKVRELGRACNFNLAYCKNPTDPENSKRGRQVTQAFLEGFATYCEENDLELAAGVDEFEEIGTASYLAVKPVDEDVLLMMLLVPHDLVDVEAEEGEQND